MNYSKLSFHFLKKSCIIQVHLSEIIKDTGKSKVSYNFQPHLSPVFFFPAVLIVSDFHDDLRSILYAKWAVSLVNFSYFWLLFSLVLSFCPLGTLFFLFQHLLTKHQEFCVSLFYAMSIGGTLPRDLTMSQLIQFRHLACCVPLCVLCCI